MRAFIELKASAESALNDSDTLVASDAARVTRILARRLDWESIDKDDLDTLVNEMATQLPDDDLDGFVTHVLGGMKLKSPRASLTVGGLCKDGTQKLRIRILAANNAVLPSLGKLVADTLLLYMSDYELSRILLWEKRQREPLLSGRLQVSAPVSFLGAIQSSPHMAIPLAIALLGLIGGGFWAYLDPTKAIWNDTLWAWYGRLFGPFVMAVVTTASAIAFQIERGRIVRTAEWEIDSVHSYAKGMVAKDSSKTA